MHFGRCDYDKEERERLQKQTEKKLDPDIVSIRPGPANKLVIYVTTQTAINEANMIFGPDGWSSSVSSLTQDFLEEDKDGRWTCVCTAVVKITLKNGSFHEDVGSGVAPRQKTLAQALSMAKKVCCIRRYKTSSAKLRTRSRKLLSDDKFYRRYPI